MAPGISDQVAELILEEAEAKMENSEGTSSSSDEFTIEKVPNPFGDGSIHADELAELSRHILSLIETTLDTESFMISLD